MQSYLRKARAYSLELEAVLRGCKFILRNHSSTILVCPFKFHRAKLVEHYELLERIFESKVEFFDSPESYVADRMKDELVRFAVKELGAEIIWKK